MDLDGRGIWALGFADEELGILRFHLFYIVT
jgi:hypothetical protein